MIDRVLPTTSAITITTTSKREFIATSLASRELLRRSSSTHGPIVAWAYAAGFSWWRIAGQVVAFDGV
jgi:hypothetical protein